MEEILLVNDKKDCCGCEVCANVCPKKAITMQEDEYGFIYPSINKEKCIKCGLCKKKCAYQNDSNIQQSVKKTYVALSEDINMIKKSASGGVFANIAREIIKNEGVVYGCTMDLENDKLFPHHIRIDKKSQISKLQGSKYVQSKMNNIYVSVKKDLLEKKVVLFSGTPCQVAALYSFLGNIDERKNLYTIDIICHGIPNIQFFQDYLKMLEKKIKGKIIDFSFRDKSEGWGLKGKVIYKDKKGEINEKIILSHLSSYYSLFLNSSIYRVNCYSCKYAGPNRIGDITIGDYWGVEKQHPEYMVVNNGKMNPKFGISCILINNKQGEILIDKFSSGLYKNKSTFEKVSQYNEQLNKPSFQNEERNIVMEEYKNNGYKGVEKYFQKKIGKKRLLYIIWNKIPRKIQLKIKK